MRGCGGDSARARGLVACSAAVRACSASMASFCSSSSPARMTPHKKTTHARSHERAHAQSHVGRAGDRGLRSIPLRRQAIRAHTLQRKARRLKLTACGAADAVLGARARPTICVARWQRWHGGGGTRGCGTARVAQWRWRARFATRRTSASRLEIISIHAASLMPAPHHGRRAGGVQEMCRAAR